MKRPIPAFVFLSISLAFAACNADPNIVPDPSPIDASVDDASSSSNSSSSSSSSASSSSGGPPGDGSGTRLKRYVHTSDDGLLVGRDGIFFDSDMGFDCSPWLTPAGLRCMPLSSAIAVDSTFADANCTIPAADTQSNCPAPLYAYSGTGSSCVAKGVYSFFHLAPNNPQKLYHINGGCVEKPVGANVTIYAVGPEVDYTQFAAMTLGHE